MVEPWISRGEAMGEPRLCHTNTTSCHGCATVEPHLCHACTTPVPQLSNARGRAITVHDPCMHGSRSFSTESGRKVNASLRRILRGLRHRRAGMQSSLQSPNPTTQTSCGRAVAVTYPLCLLFLRFFALTTRRSCGVPATVMQLQTG